MAPSAEPSFAADFAAGAVGGAAGVVCGQPLDTVRIRAQQPGAAASGALAGGVLAAVHRSLAAEGVRGLFRGVLPPLSSAGVQNAVVFAAYSRALFWVRGADHPGASSLRDVFAAGCAAGVAQTAVVTPVDLLKVRLQLRTDAAPPSPLQLARSIVRAEGPKGLFRGFGVTLLRDTPSHGLYFLAYEAGKAALKDTAVPDAAATLLAGGFAGQLSWASVYPVDVLKSRIQADPARFTGTMHCLREAVRTEGAGVLLVGFNACMYRAFVVNAAIFSGYEACMSLLMGS